MAADDATRQERMILAGHPRERTPEERLLSDSPKTQQWLARWAVIKQRAATEFLRDMAEASKQGADPDWLKRWVG